MNARTKARLMAFLAAEIAAAARRITADGPERDDALAHIELQISFIREVTYRHLRPVRSVRSGSTARKAA
jgi:hypothetical protein